MEANDMKAMREALVNIAGYAETARCHTEDVHVLSFLGEIEGWARSALAAPPRQCDVGTADEQLPRFVAAWEYAHRSVVDRRSKMMLSVFSRWAQMPYKAEEGARK